MNKRRIEIARTTLQAIDSGKYEVDGYVVRIARSVEKSMADSKLYSPEDLDELKSNVRLLKQFETEIKVENTTTLDAAKAEGGKVGVLNFASAKNPGGGFMNGAQSQEESIARSSSLYPAIDQHQEMYRFNKSRRTYLYSDYMIYTPNVVVFKEDDGGWLKEPYEVDVLTSPAVNVGAILSNKPGEMDDVEEVMIERMDKLLSLFASYGTENLILGAWGCGVFRNNAEDIARYFSEFLKPNGKYEGVFKRIVFAVLDRNDRGIYRAFKALENLK